MGFKVRSSADVRHYVVEMDSDRWHRHTLLMIEFDLRGVFSPRAGYASEPIFENGKNVGVKASFTLNLRIADEYEDRMRGRTTKKHMETTAGDIYRTFGPGAADKA